MVVGDFHRLETSSRPRFTGWYRAKYHQKVEDYELKYIQRVRLLGTKEKDATERSFGLQRFGGKEAGFTVKKAYQAFLKDVQQVAPSDTDLQTVAEFVYNEITDLKRSNHSATSIRLRISSNLPAVTLSEVNTLLSSATELSRFDKNPVTDTPTQSASSVSGSGTMFGTGIPFTCPMDQVSTIQREQIFERVKMCIDTETEKVAAVEADVEVGLEWLKTQCELYLCSENAPSDFTVENVMLLLLSEIEKSEINQMSLLDLLGENSVEFLFTVLDESKVPQLVREWEILKKTQLPPAQNVKKKKGVRGALRDTDREHDGLLKLLRLVGTKKSDDAPNSARGASNSARVADERVVIDSSAEVGQRRAAGGPSSNLNFSDYLHRGLKVVLPLGTKRTTVEGSHESVTIPAPEKRARDDPLVPITDVPDWAQVIFKGVQHFNPIQSKVYHAAFGRNSNLLVCAPTGAGKTNIALLTIARLVGQHITNGVAHADFKVVYLAPMKALCAEIATKFAKALGPVGVRVREMTGDVQLSKKELVETHVIITVPEKWDVMTRNSPTGGGEEGVQQLVHLVIIDEVHLLNDDRGAVIESVVARTKRFTELSGHFCRLVALSATLPNYMDVASFLEVSEGNVFYFDSSYRPIPLEQTFIGVSCENVKKSARMLDLTYDRMVKTIREGHQCMVFVNSRNDTYKTAEALHNIALARDETALFDPAGHKNYAQCIKDANRSRSKQVGTLFSKGYGMHHAGMLRADRSLTESLFSAGAIKVLCCTATLAWGVNLPARHVIIKGTNIFDSQSGGFKQVGILDVMQIFGRAGRPQFDHMGQATLITDHKQLNTYIRLMNHQMPIESQFEKFIVNALNAEIVMGNIASLKDAAGWLKYTYLFVRFYKNPTHYGVTNQDYAEDPTLLEKRMEFVRAAAKRLEQARLIRIDRCDNFNSTDLGRVAARFYVDWETAETYAKGLPLLNAWNDSEILALVGKSKEFAQLKVRDEELEELDDLKQDPRKSHSKGRACCKVAVKGGTENVYGKVAILLQAYISRMYVDSFSLVSDTNYIVQNAARLFRSMFEISLTRVSGASAMTERLLEWTKIIERRVWHDDHVLKHFCFPPSAQSDVKGGVLEWEMVQKLARYDYWTLLDMSYAEIKDVTRVPAAAKAVQKYARRVPNLELSAKIQPITSSIMRITLTIKPNFEWSDRWSGHMEPFYVWVENPETHDILHSEQWILKKTDLWNSSQLSFAIPLQQPIPPQYTIKIVSDRWVSISSNVEFAVSHLLLPDEQTVHTPLLDLMPLPTTALHNRTYQSLYKFNYFNAVQTQVFHTCMHTDYNILMGAPTGSGKTIVAELAMYRLFDKYPHEKVIYIAPLKALAKERMDDWGERFGRQAGKVVLELTGDFTPDVAALEKAAIVVTTPEKWDGISRHWQHRSYVRQVGLVIIDEVHLLGQDRGPVLEVIVSRMRYISCKLDKHIRFVGLSTGLANARDIADWLGIGRVGLFNFPPSVRPVPMTAHIQGYPEKHYCPRMATMNKPCFNAIRNYSPEKPTLIFVASRRQTRLTALDLKALVTAEEDMDPKSWVRMDRQEETYYAARVGDRNLRDLLEFGIGIHHAGLNEKDRLIVEELFCANKINVLVSTSTLAWGVNYPAHLVIVKGTEYFDGALKRYVDFPVADVLNMMGRAGRPQFDDSAVGVIMCHEPKKSFYHRFLYEPFPVESSLHEQLTDHLNAEVNSKTISTKEEAIDYITWTYFFRRLTANPAYYDPEAIFYEENTQACQKDHLARYIDRLINKALDELVRSRCIRLTGGGMDDFGNSVPLKIEALSLGKTASLYYMSHRTVGMFQRCLSKDPLDFIDVLKLVSECPEYDQLPVRHNEDKINAEFAETLPLEVDSAMMWDSPHTKAFLLLQSHLFSCNVPMSDYKTDLKSVLDRSIPIIQAMVDIAADEGQLHTALNLVLLLQCLHQATHPWRSDLLMLPHIHEDHVKLWNTCGPTHLAALIEGNMGHELSKLRLGSKLKEVIHVAEGLPRLRVQLALKTKDGKVLSAPYKVAPDVELVLDVELKYENDPAKFAFAPNFPKKKTYSWWVVLGDTEVDELVQLKRIMMQARRNTKRSASFVFSSPEDDVGQTFTLSVLVLSDSYVGLDQQYDINISTVHV